MGWQPNFYTLALWIAALVASGGAWAAWKRRPKTGSVPLTIAMLGLAWWAAAQGIEVAAIDAADKVFWTQVQYVGVVTVPAAWLMLVLQYTNLDARWFPYRRWLLLLVEPMITLLLAWSNRHHRLIWIEVASVFRNGLWLWRSTYGTFFWIHTAYSYALLLIGLILLARAVILAPWPYRAQALVLFAGALIPWLYNVLAMTQAVDFPINPTAIAFIIAAIMAYWGLFRYHLFDLAPIARDALVDSMGDAMVALNLDQRIVDANRPALAILGRPLGQIIGKRLPELLPQHEALYERYRENMDARTELPLTIDGHERWYDLQISPLFNRRGRPQGRLIVLRDISERKMLEASLEAQVRRVNQLLDVANTTTRDPSLDATMSNTLDIACSLGHADLGGLFLVNDTSDITYSRVFDRTDLAGVPRDFLDYMIDQGFVGWVLRERRAIHVENLAKDTRWMKEPPPSGAVASVMGIPILYGERLLGALILLHAEPGHFHASEIDTLVAATRQMALALGNALVYENQRRVAEQQATLFKVLRALQYPMTLQRAIVKAVDTVAYLTGWPVVALLTVTESGQLRVNAAAGRLAGQIMTLPEVAAPIPNYTSESGVQCVVDALPDDLLPSVLMIPLQDDVARVLLVASDKAVAFDEDARLLANSLGDVVTLVLRDARLYESVSTERQRLAALVQSSRDGIIMISTNNDILVINATAMGYLGLEGEPTDWLYRPLPEALGLLRAYAPAVARASLAEIHRLQGGDLGPGEGEYTVLGRIIHWVNLAVTTEDHTLGRLLMLHDVTRERQVEHLREELVHTMVHDLRNPLTGIHGALSGLERHFRATMLERPQALLDIAQRSTQQMLGLVNAILDISRLESGRMPLNQEIFVLEVLMDEVVALLKPQAEKRGMHVAIDVPAPLPPVWGDQQFLARVLQNLLDNALKFAPEGSAVHLAAALVQSQTGTPKVHVSVQDAGSGIPPEVRDSLFQKFVTGQQSNHGSGLGLALCKMVLDAHGETIRAESVPGQGATFTFTLPLASRVMEAL